MFKEDKKCPLKIKMTEGDFGVILPIILDPEEGEIITENTSFLINIFKEIDTEPLISKNYSNIENNTIEFSLTEQETLLIPIGKYFYDLDWYQNGVFMCNLVDAEEYIVEKKGKKVGDANES